MMKLSVNIDHVATLRQARGGSEPSVLEAAKIVESAGADGITMHLREDRRHIQDADIFAVKKITKLPINLEMALSDELVDIAIKLQPRMVTLVPEKRQEITTEGGLDVKKFYDKAFPIIKTLQNNNIIVSLFIDPFSSVVKVCEEIGADMVELHTGSYVDLSSVENDRLIDFKRVAENAKSCGLKVAAGHGLNYTNTKQLMPFMKDVSELNIGHSIISRAVFVGLEKAVDEMLCLIREA